MTNESTFEHQAEDFRQKYKRIKAEIGKVIVGHDEVVHGVLTCLMIGGHCLLEGAPGLGKTLLVRTLAQAYASIVASRWLLFDKLFRQHRRFSY